MLRNSLHPFRSCVSGDVGDITVADAEHFENLHVISQLKSCLCISISGGTKFYVLACQGWDHSVHSILESTHISGFLTCH